MKRHKVFLALGIALVAIVALVIGLCAANLNLGDIKGPHTFPLAGNDPLTTEQAVSLAAEVLILDKRDVANMTPLDSESAPATQPFVTIHAERATLRYLDQRTHLDWFVTLERSNGRVVGYSSHGL